MTMKEEFTAIDMATAAADGFRAGQRAAQSAGVPDAEPVLIQAVAVTRDDEEEGLRLEWLLEGGIAEMEFAGQVLFAMPEANSLCDEDGSAHVYIAPPAAPTVKAEQGTTSDKYRAELYDEVWQKARDIGYGNVTDALVELERLKPAPSLPAAGSAEEELWAVHAQGPDDLYPAFSRDDADTHAAALNSLPMPEGISVSAVVVPSPWPAVEHWKYLAEQERDHVAALPAQQSAHVSVPDTARLNFMLQKNRKVICERLPHDNFEVYVEEGFMGDKRHPGVRYSGNWENGSHEALEIKREAIDRAILNGGEA